MAQRAAAALLPLSVFKSEKKTMKQQEARSAPWFPIPAVRDVILWTLFHAGVFTVCFAFVIADEMLQLLVQPSCSCSCPCPVETTTAMTGAKDALMAGMLWCATPQAAAAVVAALLLPSHRRRLRLFLANAALGATFATHFMMADGVRTVVAGADPGGLWFRTGFTTAVIFLSLSDDLHCLLGLVLRGGEE